MKLDQLYRATINEGWFNKPRQANPQQEYESAANEVQELQNQLMSLQTEEQRVVNLARTLSGTGKQQAVQQILALRKEIAQRNKLIKIAQYKHDNLSRNLQQNTTKGLDLDSYNKEFDALRNELEN